MFTPELTILAKEADSFLAPFRQNDETTQFEPPPDDEHSPPNDTSKLKQSQQDIIKNISTSTTSQAYRLIISVIYPRFYIYHEVYHRRIIVNVRRPLICS